MAFPPSTETQAFAPFDTRLVSLRKERLSRRNYAGAFLHERAVEDFIERLEAIPRRFERVLVLGGGALFSRALISRPELRARLGHILDADAPVIEPAEVNLGTLKFNLILAPLALHWTNDLPGVFANILRALEGDGLMLASMLGGDTLMELRLSLLEAETELTGGAGARVSPFVRLEDLARLLERAGFALPAADRDRVSVGYENLLALVSDLRAMGETAAFSERSPPLRRDVFAKAAALYAERYSDSGGRLRASFEILTATGWAPHESQQKPLKPGSAKTRLADALGVEETPVKRED
jgi:hypothetical protein